MNGKPRRHLRVGALCLGDAAERLPAGRRTEVSAGLPIGRGESLTTTIKNWVPRLLGDCLKVVPVLL